jgi:glycosyltransferase involved in cell wall biosynthesis
MDRLPGEPGAETVVVNPGIPEVALRRNGDPTPGGPAVISHGAGERPEAIDLLLHAFATLAAGRPEATLVLLGHLAEAAERRLHETASNLGIRDAIGLPGHLEEAEYWRAIGEADVAVQLRTSSDGEVSGSVCDCLAARVPTIVSAVGWMEEVPNPAVLHLPRGSAPSALAERIEEVLDDPALRERIRTAQDEYAMANSYERVAERYAELLEL